MAHNLRLFLLSTASAALLVSCGEGAKDAASAPDSSAETSTTASEQSQTEAINQWFEVEFERQVARSPMFQTFLGRKTDYDKWDDASDEFERESHALEMAALAEMRAKFNLEDLGPQAQLSYRLCGIQH